MLEIIYILHTKSNIDISKDAQHINDNDTSDKEFPYHVSFMTSTPQKVKFECVNKEQRTDCFVLLLP